MRAEEMTAPLTIGLGNTLNLVLLLDGIAVGKEQGSSISNHSIR